jgi:hypothetical protein
MPHKPQVRTIFLQPEAPPKPAPGAACNGCGLCCAAEPCPLGMLVSRRRQGACAALQWQAAENRYRCGLLAEPRPWLPAALARRWIAAGAGCDSDLQRA